VATSDLLEELSRRYDSTVFCGQKRIRDEPDIRADVDMWLRGDLFTCRGAVELVFVKLNERMRKIAEGM